MGHKSLRMSQLGEAGATAASIPHLAMFRRCTALERQKNTTLECVFVENSTKRTELEGTRTCDLNFLRIDALNHYKPLSWLHNNNRVTAPDSVALSLLSTA